MEGQLCVFGWIPDVFGTNLFFFAFEFVHSCMFNGVSALEDANWHLSTSRRFPVNFCLELVLDDLGCGGTQPLLSI